ncbi:MAG: hypothetical protein AAF710_02105 [Planctomycetota bacterium]
MKTICRTLVLTLGLVLAAPAAPAADTPGTPDTADLRPALTPGQTTRYEFWNRIQQSATVALAGRQRTQDSSLEIVGEVTWTVRDAPPDGSSTCSMTLDWMSLTNRPAGQPEQVIDSRRPASPDTEIMHELITAMAGVTLTVTLGPDGEVTNLTGLDRMNPKTTRPELLPSDLDFRETASDLAALAKAPPGTAAAHGNVAVGTTWDADFRWDHDLGQVDQDWTYTLEAVEDLAGVPVAVVTGTADLSLDPDPDAAGQLPPGTPAPRIRMLDGRATTRVLYDLTRREAVGRHSTAAETVEVRLQLPDGNTFTRTLTETLTGQVLRLSED